MCVMNLKSQMLTREMPWIDKQGRVNEKVQYEVKLRQKFKELPVNATFIAKMRKTIFLAIKSGLSIVRRLILS